MHFRKSFLIHFTIVLLLFLTVPSPLWSQEEQEAPPSVDSEETEEELFDLTKEMTEAEKTTPEEEGEETISFGPEDAVDLGEVVVTATRTNKSIYDSPVQTEVIGKDFIEDSGADSLDDLFGDIGIEYAETGMGSHIQLQGMDGERVLFLIDGKKITGRVAGNLVTSMIPLENIERVEIVRGPQSALYGSEAIGGVINIITKKPSYEPAGGFTVKNHLLLPSDGSDSEWKSLLREQTASGYIEIPLGNFSTRFSLFGGRAFPYLNENDTSLLPGYLHGKATLDNDLTLGLQTLLTFGGNISLHRSDDQTSSSGSLERIDTHKADGYATLEQGIGDKSTLSVTGTYSYFFRDKNQYSALLEEWYNSGTEAEHTAGADVLFSSYLTDHNELTAAVSYTYDQLSKYNIQNSEVQNRHTVALVLQDEQFTNGKYSILPGVRGELNSDYGAFVSPKLSGMFYLGKLFRILPSVGVGYRAPSFLELYLDSAGDIYHKFGNEDLVPEKSIGFNTGVEFLPGFMTVKLNLFHNELFDEIAYNYYTGTDTEGNPVKEYDENNLHIIVKENISRSTRTGFDLSGTVSPLSFLYLNLNYGFLFAWDRNMGEQILNQPMHSLSGRVKFLFETIGLITYLDANLQTPHSRSEQTIFTFDFYISKSIGEAFKIFGGVDNITGQRDDFSIYLFGPVFYTGVDAQF